MIQQWYTIDFDRLLITESEREELGSVSDEAQKGAILRDRNHRRPIRASEDYQVLANCIFPKARIQRKVLPAHRSVQDGLTKFAYSYL